jgi:hypothetical protein
MTLEAPLANAKDLLDRLKFQVSLAIALGLGLALLLLDVPETKAAAATAFALPMCLVIGSLIEKAVAWKEARDEKKGEKLRDKLGLLPASMDGPAAGAVAG